MKEYILDTFKIGMSEKEAEKYFSKEIKKMNITERKIYLKNERKYFKFFKILLKRNRKFIIKIREYFEYEISNLFKKEQKMLKKEIININKFNFKFKNMHLKNRKYLEIFLKISYRDAFGYQGMYTIYFPKDKIYINAITDYQFIIIFINNNKEEIIKIAKKCKLFIGLLQIRSNDEEGLESLGRPANEYVKKKFGEDNNSKIKLTTDGIDLSNADVGEKVGDVNTQDDRNSGYAEILPSQQRDSWLNKMNFKLLRLRKNTDEFVEKTLISSFYLHMRAYSILSDSGETIRDFTLGALKAGGEDLSLNTYKIPKRFQYNTLAYKYGELFGHSTMSAIGIVGTIIGSGMEGGGTAAAPATGGVSLGVAALGAGVETYSVGLGATAASKIPKTSLEIKAMKSEGSSSSSSKTETYDKKEKDEKLEKIELEPKEKRPTYRESEKDVYDFLGEKYKDNENITVQEQASFKGGQEAKHYGEKGSVRPDDTVIIKTETKNGTVISRESYEVKNYKIENYNNMTSKIGEQAKIRVNELPKGTVQKVVIDTRGQNLTTEIEAKTINDIVKKSNGIINAENIFFIKQEVN